MKHRLLIIEDDSIFCQTMQGHMQSENIEVYFGKSLANALESVLEQEYCLLIAAIQPAKNEDKLWNKNMVARILENGKYIGQPGWPTIVDTEMFERANEKRSSKVSLPQRTKAQKILRRLGGGNNADVEQAVRQLLNLLLADPQQIVAPQQSPTNLNRVVELRSALDHELEQRPVNEDAAKRLAMELASAQYEGIGSQEYETERLQRLFQRQVPMDALDAELLQTAVSKIQIHSKKVKIHLKNGQIFERRTQT